MEVDRLIWTIAPVLLRAMVLAAAVSFGFPLALTGALNQTDYQRDLGRLKSRFAALDGSASPAEKAYTAMQIYWLTGLPKDREAADELLQRADRQSPSNDELRYLMAKWLAYHHQPMAAAEYYFSQPVKWPDEQKLIGLKVDIALQQGRTEEANSLLEQNPPTSNHWFLLAQYATVLEKTGQTGRADEEYANAEDLLTAKSMRDYAWLELQRGYLALSHGRTEDAEQHYRLAMRSYTGYWLAADYWAEWLAAQQHYEAAAAAYLRLAVCQRKPELYQALGDLYLYMGQTSAAKIWHDKALNHYLASTARGETQYYHHLATLYADAYADGAEAVKWAQKDLEQRSNALTHDALAWAYFRNGQFQQALLEARQSLGLNWEDAHLYAHAGMIFLAAGLNGEAQYYVQRAKQINPQYEAFHAHR